MIYLEKELLFYENWDRIFETVYNLRAGVTPHDSAASYLQELLKSTNNKVNIFINN